jgi:hypothetical protein
MTTAHPAPASSPAAGWYPDAQGVQRWWDGQGWTEHVQPQPVPQQYAQPVIVDNGSDRRFYKTSHGFHLIMSIVTLGLWLPVWGIMAIMNSTRSH